MKQIPIKKFSPYWKECRQITSEYYHKLNILEKKMRKELDNNQLEFFYCDGELAGIGTIDRKMKLIHDSQLDKEI
jgi:hypothetical protein